MVSILTLRLEYASDLEDVRLIGRQDPYCLVRIGDEEHKSANSKNGGKNPVWNQDLR